MRPPIDDDTADEIAALAQYEIDEGDPARGVELCEQLIEYYTNTDGPDSEVAMTWRGFLGRALNEARLHDRAEAVLRALVADRTRVLGADHPATLVARGNLNRSIGFSGRTSEALDASYALLADRERILGVDHRDTLRSRGTISRLRDLRGEHDEAFDELEALYADRMRILGPGDPDTIENRFNLTYHRAERTDDLSELDGFIAEVVAEHGADHPVALTIRTHRPALLEALGHYDEAHAELGSIYADRIRVLGELHPSTLTSGLALTRSTWDRGDHIEARRMQEALRRVISATLGPRHQLALSARTDHLAMCADELSDDEYWALFEALVDDAAGVFDEASPGWMRIVALHPEYFDSEEK